jgi:hypothetical protein
MGLSPLLLGETEDVVDLKIQRVLAERNRVVDAAVWAHLKGGFHVNSHTPNGPYLIPLRLTWDRGPLEVLEIVYPKPTLENYPFSKEPVSVFSGDFNILTRFRISPSAPFGPGILTGRLRYQACNAVMCLPPKTVPVTLSYSIKPAR